MTEPKIDLVELIDRVRRHYCLPGNDDVYQVTVAAEQLIAENAGLREALEASERRCADLISRERNVWDRINTWNDDPVTRLQAFAITHEDLDAAVKERDAMCPVVEAARIVLSAATAALADALDGRRTTETDLIAERMLGPIIRLLSEPLAAVDSYAQSSNPGETS